MQFHHLKSYAIDKMRVKLSLFALSLTFLLSVYYYEASHTGSEDKFKKHSIDLRDKVFSKKEYLRKSKAAIDKWNSEVIYKNTERAGLQLESFRKLIDELTTKYRLTNLQINLVTPNVRDDIVKLEKIYIKHTNVKISFNAFTDVDVYKFIMELSETLPGYINIQKLDMVSDIEVDELLANKIARTGQADIVKVRMDIIWHDIEDKK